MTIRIIGNRLVANHKHLPQRFVIGCTSLLMLAMLLVTTTQADLMTFDFASTTGSNQTGFDLDDVDTGMSHVVDNTFTITLTATAGTNGSGDVFNHTSGPNFGVNASGAGDVADAIDDGAGLSESIVLSFQSSSPVTLTFVSIDFDRITGNAGPQDDAGSLAFAGGNTFHFNANNVDGSDLLTVGEIFLEGQTITLSHVSGNGFGIEQIVLDVVPVPEPGTSAALVALLLGLRVRRTKVRS